MQAIRSIAGTLFILITLLVVRSHTNMQAEFAV